MWYDRIPHGFKAPEVYDTVGQVALSIRIWEDKTSQYVFERAKHNNISLWLLICPVAYLVVCDPLNAWNICRCVIYLNRVTACLSAGRSCWAPLCCTIPAPSVLYRQWTNTFFNKPRHFNSKVELISGLKSLGSPYITSLFVFMFVYILISLGAMKNPHVPCDLS